MGKLNRLDFIFDNPNNVCFSGTALRGSVIVDLNGKMKIKGCFIYQHGMLTPPRNLIQLLVDPAGVIIRLRFHGYSNVSWSERHSTGTGKNKRSITKNFYADELYFDHTVGLLGSSYDEVRTFPAGFHTFPFEFYVPAGCPTSYEGSVGKIRYFVSARIEKLFGMEHVAMHVFTVVNHLDLNEDPRLRENSEAGNEMTLCCLCCKSGPISATLTVDTIGYVPGEVLPLRVDINNQSGRKITGANISLLMIVKYIASKKTKTHTNVVASATCGGVKAGKSETWLGDKLVVPSLPPTLLNSCKIMHISYILELSVHPSGPAFDLPIKMEVIIGTVPIKPVQAVVPPAVYSPPPILKKGKPEENSRFKPLNRSPSLDRSASVIRNLNSTGIVPKASLPHLRFEESVLGKVDVEDEPECDLIYNKITFVPMYPYYSLGSREKHDAFQVDYINTGQNRNING